MKFRIILLAFLLSLPFTVLAQIQIGDLKVESLKQLFNENNSLLWGEFGALNKVDSDVWITNMPSMLFNTGEDKSIILVFKKELNQDSVRTDLIN